MKYLLILIFSSCACTYAQSWRPVFEIPLGAELLVNNNRQLLNEYLERDVSRPSVGKCEVKLSLFNFRVNGHGKIDSIYVDGNLNSEATTQIIKNIQKTEGKWKVPDKTKATDNCWFVYPFFVFGN